MTNNKSRISRITYEAEEKRLTTKLAINNITRNLTLPQSVWDLIDSHIDHILITNRSQAFITILTKNGILKPTNPQPIKGWSQ